MTHRPIEQNREPRKYNQLVYIFDEGKRQYNGAKSVSSTNGVGTSEHSHAKRMNLDTNIIPLQKLTPNSSM